MSLRKRVGRLLARRRFRGSAVIAGHALKFGGHVAGVIDDCRDGRVRGWVYDASRPSKVVDLEVLLDGTVAAAGQATGYREDLAEILGDEGVHGFDIEVEDLLLPRRDRRLVTVRLAGKPDYVIGPFEVPPETVPAPGGLRAEAGMPAASVLLYELPQSSFAGIGRLTPVQWPDEVEETIFRTLLEEAIWRKKTRMPGG